MYKTLQSPSVGEEMVLRRIEGTPRGKGYFWGGELLSSEEARKHFVVIGATGSGKSITLNMLLQSVLAKMGQGDGIKRRVLVYDAKSDLVGFIARQLPPRVKLRILNPLDRRFAAWDIGADVRTETDAIEFASALVPKSKHESSPYFADTSRALVAGVIKRLIASADPAGAWTLRDVILAFESIDTLKTVLSHSDTRYLLDHFRPENDKNFGGVKSTVDTALAVFRPIAALLHAALVGESKSEKPEWTRGVAVRDPAANSLIDRTPFSLRKWVNGAEDSVVVIGNDENAREATDTLNRLLFRQLSKALISRDGVVKGEETWIFLDELREAGALSGLRQLLLRGRSKGVSVAMGFQDVEGIHAEYGAHEGAEIIGAAQNVIVLHVNATAPKTAEWASQVFGSRRTQERSHSVQHGKEEGMSSNVQMQLIPNVLPIEFTQLPMPTPQDGLAYYAYTNRQKHGFGHYEWEFLEEEGPLRIDGADVADFVGRNLEQTRLIPWGADLFSRLHFEIQAEKKSEKEPTSSEKTTDVNPLL